MKDLLTAGDPSRVTWTHASIACAVLLVYLAVGVHLAFRVARQRRRHQAGER